MLLPTKGTGAERPAAQPENMRRAWIKRRAAISSAAIDLILERALGELPADVTAWPTPTWAGPIHEAAHVA